MQTPDEALHNYRPNTSPPLTTTTSPPPLTSSTSDEANTQRRHPGPSCQREPLRPRLVLAPARPQQVAVYRARVPFCFYVFIPARYALTERDKEKQERSQMSQAEKLSRKQIGRNLLTTTSSGP